MVLLDRARVLADAGLIREADDALAGAAQSSGATGSPRTWPRRIWSGPGAR